MGPVWVTRNMLEFETRVELNGPLACLEIMRRDRELGKRETQSRAPEDDAATVLRRPVSSRLEDVEADLIPVGRDHVLGFVRCVFLFFLEQGGWT